LCGGARLCAAPSVTGSTNLPLPLDVALDFPYPIASEIFYQRTHFMPPRMVHPGCLEWKKVGVLVVSL
jgi:hypothetical protein